MPKLGQKAFSSENKKQTAKVNRLKLEDGDKVRVVFLGEYEMCLTKWDANKPTRLSKWEDGAKRSFLFNVYNTENGELQLLETSKRTLDLLEARVADKFETNVVEIERIGTGTATMYMVNPLDVVPADITKKVKKLELYDLKDLVKPQDADAE